MCTCGLQQEQDDDESENDLELSTPTLLQLKFLSIPFLEPDKLFSFTPFITSPNLEEVEFPIDIYSLMPYGEDIYDYYAVGEIDLESVKELLDILLNKGETPSLQTIRLLKMNSWRPKVIKYWLEELENKFWERGVRLQIEMPDG